MLGCEMGATKDLKSEKGGHENYKANLNLSYVKRKLLPSMIFVKPCIYSHSITKNEYYHVS